MLLPWMMRSTPWMTFSYQSKCSARRLSERSISPSPQHIYSAARWTSSCPSPRCWQALRCCTLYHSELGECCPHKSVFHHQLIGSRLSLQLFFPQEMRLALLALPGSCDSSYGRSDGLLVPAPETWYVDTHGSFSVLASTCWSICHDRDHDASSVVRVFGLFGLYLFLRVFSVQ